ncbi:MAG: hypothetical protein C5S48_04285 [Candidatus Methanogaster sp.]|nr:MAG: hypothetical protein C5S48_04285 [ANME-2 cluster archaeon]
MEWVLMRFAWRIVASGINVECRAVTKSNWMRNRYVQALDLSPGFSDFWWYRGGMPEVGMVVRITGFMGWCE